jgi:hypothetical protein
MRRQQAVPGRRIDLELALLIDHEALRACRPAGACPAAPSVRLARLFHAA